jgi:hypothetical protein
MYLTLNDERTDLTGKESELLYQPRRKLEMGGHMICINLQVARNLSSIHILNSERL